MTNPDYFTLAELRALPDCGGDAFEDGEILAAAAYFVEIVEREVHRPLVPRTITDELDGTGRRTVLLSTVPVRSLISVTVDGVSVNVALLTGRHGRLRYKTTSYAVPTVFPCGIGNVTAVYSAGEDACPADIKDAVMWATRDRLISQSEESGSWDRKTSQTNEFGTTTYVLPGEKRPTGYPELDALIASYTRNTASFGFA